MNHDRIIELYARKLAKEATDAELAEFTELLKSEDEQFFHELISSWWKIENSTNTSVKKERDDHFNKILDIANSTDLIDNAMIVDDKSNFAKKIKPFLKWSIATAAVLIGLAVCLPYFKNNFLDKGDHYNEIIAKRGTKTKIILPDGSQVWLNSDSKLSYGARFNDTIREVSLEGEAYFDVIKDQKRPFVVMTNALNIRVLGTAFNIKSYAKDATIETTLIRGMIEVRKNNEPATTKIVLTPNEKLIYNKSEALLVRPNNEQNTIGKKLEALSVSTLSKNIPDSSRVETAWIYGRLVFDGDSFVTLAEKMERWYDIKITIQNQSISNNRFSGVFEKENVEEAFKALQLITMFKYDIHDNEVLIK
jgi:ferric-dicitrate binding protein FerR (iron transport regulator)/succinate dehydrogenase flavin-adding protein (antitoxin of CptAB toxin-antitoxin module)